MNCPNCGAVCADHQNFCKYCGVSLHTAEPSKKGSHKVPLLILLALSILGIAVFFASSFFFPGNTAFSIQSGALYFNESAYDGPTDITVPETLDDRQIIDLSDYCFSNCTWITAVEIPDTVELIGSFAFQNCTSLRGIQLPASLIAVGSGAFYGCSSLEAISIPGTVAFIAPDAFDACPSLTYIFYAGTCQQWLDVYGANFPTGLTIYCADGNLMR